jgi:hypothetical protein
LDVVKDDITKHDYEDVAEYRHAIRRFLRFSEEAARANGVTPQQYQLMLAIKGYPGREHANISELAERMQLDHHTHTHTHTHDHVPSRHTSTPATHVSLFRGS